MSLPSISAVVYNLRDSRHATQRGAVRSRRMVKRLANRSARRDRNADIVEGLIDFIQERKEADQVSLNDPDPILLDIDPDYDDTSYNLTDAYGFDWSDFEFDSYEGYHGYGGDDYDVGEDYF